MTGALSKQVGGDHYRSMAIQPATYILANNLGWAEGCAIGYLSRWREKGGVEDLRKAVHQIELLIEAEKPAGGRKPVATPFPAPPDIPAPEPSAAAGKGIPHHSGRSAEMLNFLPGYKTHIVVAVYLLGIFVEKALGMDVPGFEVGNDWFNSVLQALGVSTFRQAINPITDVLKKVF